MHLKYIMLLATLTLSSCAFQNQKLTQVDQWLQDRHVSDHFHGSVTIGVKQGIVYSKSFGIADRNWSIPNSESTRFDIGSINKSFIAYMIMQMVEAGKLALEDKLSKHLNYVGPHKEQITLHQLLTHTSGIPDYDQMPDSLKVNQFEAGKRLHFDTDGYIKFISSLGSVGKPGAQFYYSNFAYHLLALLIEEKTQKHFSEALDSMICKPLGLKQTYAPLDNYQVYTNVATPYQYKEEEFFESPFIDYSLGRRIFSTTSDLYWWGREMQDPTLISRASQQLMLTNHLPEINSEVSYGYGWVVFDGLGTYRMGKMDVTGNYIIHGGATDGYRALLVVYEEGEWIVSILGNTGRMVDELRTGEQILKILTEK